jgi:hypothetical protein
MTSRRRFPPECLKVPQRDSENEEETKKRRFLGNEPRTYCLPQSSTLGSTCTDPVVQDTIRESEEETGSRVFHSVVPSNRSKYDDYSHTSPGRNRNYREKDNQSEEHAPNSTDAQPEPDNVANRSGSDVPNASKRRIGVLDIRKMLPYTIVSKLKRKKSILAVTLGVLLVMQLFLVLADSYVSYGAQSKHSGCVCSFRFEWLLTFSLRFYTRFVIPLTVSVVFWRQIIRPRPPTRVGGDGIPERSQEEAFSTELLRSINLRTVRSFIEKFWYSTLVNESVEKQLISVQDYFEEKLGIMLKLAITQPVILGLSLAFFNVFNLSDPKTLMFIKLLGIVDIISLSLVSFATGIMLSFYFIEVDIKKYIRSLCTISGTGKILLSKAKRVETCITDRWYPLEIGMRFSSVIYPILLIISWASSSPLSCGFSLSDDALDESKFAAGCWLLFIVSIGVGQLLTTAPLSPGYLGPTGMCSEVILLVFLWFFSPTLEWSALTHILYALIPMCFLVWYHVVSIGRQWVAINRVNDNQTHVSRLFSRSGFLVLIVIGLCASLYTDYRHLHPLGLSRGHSQTSDVSIGRDFLDPR